MRHQLTILKIVTILVIVLPISLLLDSCFNSSEEIIEKQTEYYELKKHFYNRISSLLCYYNLKENSNIVITRWGKGGEIEIDRYSRDTVDTARTNIDIMNDSMPLLYEILPHSKSSDLNVIWNHGIIRFSTDWVPNKHKFWTCLVYRYVSEDSLKKLWDTYEFYDNVVPDRIDKWFYKLDSTWYILSPDFHPY